MLQLPVEIINEILCNLTKHELIPLLQTPILRGFVVERFYNKVVLLDANDPLCQEQLSFIIMNNIFPKQLVVHYDFIDSIIILNPQILYHCHHIKVILHDLTINMNMLSMNKDNIISFLSSINNFTLHNMAELEFSQIAPTIQQCFSNDNIISVKTNEKIDYSIYKNLQHIELNQATGTNLEFPDLPSVKIDHVNFHWIKFPVNLTDLTISCNTTEFLYKGHPNLKSLKFHCSSNIWETFDTINCPALTVLELDAKMMLHKFTCPENLMELSLKNVMIKHLTLPPIKKLTLSSCKILTNISLPSSLTVVEIKNTDAINKIDKFPALKHLKIVNRLVTIPWPLPSSLESLDLSWNKLTDFNYHLPNLKHLNLSQNRLETFNISAANLQTLNLSSNALVSISLALPQLKRLDLSINQVNQCKLDNNYQLTWLDLSRNNLPLDIINQLPESITKLKLNLNKFNEPCGKIHVPSNLSYLWLNYSGLSIYNLHQLITSSVVHVELYKTEVNIRSGILHLIQNLHR